MPTSSYLSLSDPISGIHCSLLYLRICPVPGIMTARILPGVTLETVNCVPRCNSFISFTLFIYTSMSNILVYRKNDGYRHWERIIQNYFNYGFHLCLQCHWNILFYEAWNWNCSKTTAIVCGDIKWYQFLNLQISFSRNYYSPLWWQILLIKATAERVDNSCRTFSTSFSFMEQKHVL